MVHGMDRCLDAAWAPNSVAKEVIDAGVKEYVVRLINTPFVHLPPRLSLLFPRSFPPGAIICPARRKSVLRAVGLCWETWQSAAHDPTNRVLHEQGVASADERRRTNLETYPLT